MALTEEGLIRVPGFLSRWVRLPTGERAHYMTSGETGPAVVLLHGGIPGSSAAAVWYSFAPLLAARGFRVYCPDLPGYGLADMRAEFRATFGSYTRVDFVNRFADALCLDQFFLAGNSMGSNDTAHYVVRYPHRVSRFVLIAGPIGDEAPFRTDKRLRASVTWDGQRSTMTRMLASILFYADQVSDDLMDMRVAAADLHNDEWAAHHRTDDAGVMPQDIKIALSTRNRLSQLHTPGICMYGANDVILPPDDLGHLIEDALPRVQFFYPANCGHQGHTDQPEVFCDVFAEFFITGKVSRATAERAGVSRRRPVLAELVD